MQSHSKINSNWRKKSDPSLVEFVLGIERNGHGQIYLVHGLQKALHFSVPTSNFKRIIERPYPSDRESNVRQIPHLLLRRSSNYVSTDKRTVVYNAIPDIMRNKKNLPQHQKAIIACTKLVIGMFEDGLSESFSILERKRSGVSKNSYSNADELVDGSCVISMASILESCEGSQSSKSHLSKSSKRRFRKKKKSAPAKIKGAHECALPTITCGWSTNDAHQYKNNRSTIANNLRPFLRTGGIPKAAREKLFQVVIKAIRSMPKDAICFDMETEVDDVLLKYRKDMAKQFVEMLGGDCDDLHFRVEGITIIIPLSIAAHRDRLNCFSGGMESVLQINTRIPLNEQTVNGGRNSVMWKWLELNGYSDWFPCSVILYGRKCVYDYCLKMANMKRFSQKDSLRQCLNWALVKRVNTVVDYVGTIWNNNQFADKFDEQAKVQNNSRFGGLMMELTASYDKSVSSLPLHAMNDSVFLHSLIDIHI